MFKEKVIELWKNFDIVPQFFTRGNRIFLTNDTKVCLTKDGRIIYSNKEELKNRRYQVYSIKTFFLGRPKLKPCMEKDVLDMVEEFLLFKRLNEKNLTAQNIIHCKNQEIRRELLDRYGYEKLVAEMRGIVIHTDGDYQLVKLNWHDKEEPIKLVRVKDSTTSRWYLLRVPPNMKTCKQAIAWTFNLNEQEYIPEKET